MVFSGAGGFSRALRAARKPGLLRWNTLFVTFFCVCSVCAAQLLGPLASGLPRPMVARSVLFLCTDALLYLGAAAAVRKISPSLWKKAGGALSSGALNTLVLSMPFLQEALSMDFLSSLGYALGTGAAFWLASVLLHSALQICATKTCPGLQGPSCGPYLRRSYLPCLLRIFRGTVFLKSRPFGEVPK